MKYFALLLFLIAVPASVRAQTLTCNFWISPAGGGNGLSFGSPQTLAGAQPLWQAATADAAHRVVCAENGTYSFGTLTLGGADQYVTLVCGNGPGGNCHVSAAAGYIGSVVMLSNNISLYAFTWDALNAVNGQNTSPANGEGLFLAGNGMTVRWNDFPGCQYSCLSLRSTTNSLVDSNTFENMTPGNHTVGSGNMTIAINAFGGQAGTFFTHNKCSNNDGGCIDVADDGPGNPPTGVDNTGMSYTCNYGLDDLLTCADCGEFYYHNAGCHAGNVNINDNVSLGSGNTQTTSTSVNCVPQGNGGGCPTQCGATSCVYLDDFTCNTTIARNVCAQNNGTTTGANEPGMPEYGIHIHGGNNNTVKNNLIQEMAWASFNDTYCSNSTGDFPLAYQNCATCSTQSGNAFQGNITFNNGSWPAQSYWGLGGPPSSGNTFSNNDYWTTVPGNWGGPADSVTFNLNPTLSSPATNNFTMGNGALNADAVNWPASVPNCSGGSGPAGTGPVPYGITLTNFSAATPTPTPSPTPTPGGVQLIACATAHNAGTGNVTVNEPTGTASGNLMIGTWGGQASHLATTLAGWTIIGSCKADGGGGAGCWYSKVAGGSEPANYTFVSGAGGGWTAMSICTFSGENQSTPIDVTGTAANGSSTTPTAPSVTTTVNNDVPVWMFEVQAATFTGPVTSPAGATTQQAGGTSVGVSMSYGAAKTPAGATGTSAGSMPSGAWSAQTVAIEPALASPTPTIDPTPTNE